MPSPKRRRIRKGYVKRISLVNRGANQLPVVYKSENGKPNKDSETDSELMLLMKSEMTEAGEILACVYAPQLRDSQGDIADASVIKQMAHDYAKNGEGIDIMHDERVVSSDRAFIAENFIIQKNDERFVGFTDYSGNPVDVTGGWGVVIKVDDEHLRRAYRSGELNGVSMDASLLVEAEKSEEDSLLSKLLKLIKGDDSEHPSSLGEDTMTITKAELDAAIEASSKATIDGVTKGIGALFTGEGPLASLMPEKKSENKDTFEAPEPPVFDVSKLSDPNYISEFAMQQATHKAYCDAKGDVAAFAQSLKAIDAQYSQELTSEQKAAGILTTDDEKVRGLKTQLFAYQQKSNQSPGDGDRAPDGTGNIPGLSAKSEQLLNAGRLAGMASRGLRLTNDAKQHQLPVDPHAALIASATA